MKNTHKILSSLFATLLLCGCGNDFLNTKYPIGLDTDSALNSVVNVETATNGVYYRLFNYRFAGNYATTIADLAGDMTTFNDATNHWAQVYKYTVTPSTVYLSDIWDWGYKTVDNAAEVIVAANSLLAGIDANDDTGDRERLQLCIAQASALKGLATLLLTNIYGLPIKVNGTDNSSAPGVVAVEAPIPPEETVSRATVGECYARIIADFERAIELFEEVGDTGNSNNLGLAATEGLLARTYLYMENWDGAKEHAQSALDIFDGQMIYDATAYKNMYTSVGANSESIFKLGIDSSDNWSANSCGTLWTTYGYSPSFAYAELIAETDIRSVLLESDGDEKYLGGKFVGEAGNPAVATNFMVRIPEMYLIIAESELNSTSGTIENARTALLNVAKRNSAIASVADLPSDKTDLTAFLENERTRELFQEGHRFFDLRRWGKMAGVSAVDDKFNITDYDIAKFCFPIPANEINAGFGVEQTPNWDNYLPASE